MESRMDRFQTWREQIKEEAAFGVEQTEINSQIDYFTTQLAFMFDTSQTQRIDALKQKINLKNFNINYQLFTAFYVNNVQLEMIRLIEQVKTSLVSKTPSGVNPIQYQVNFYNKHLSNLTEPKPQSLNNQVNQHRLQRLLAVSAHYQQAKTTNINNKVIIATTDQISATDFSAEYRNYNDQIKTLKTRFNKQNALLLSKIRNFKIKGKWFYYFLPVILCAMTFFLGLALLFK